VSAIDTAQIEAMKAVAANKSPATLQVRVRSMRWEAPGVLSLDLTAPDLSPLAGFEPGAHIDLHLPNGVMRQYSLCGDHSDTSRYRIAIRSVSGGLSSQFIHRKLHAGELLTVSAPRNNFEFVDAENYLFIDGGIGITPLLPMMRRAAAVRKPWTLLFCNRSDDEAPFLDEIRALGGTIKLHSTAAGTRLDVAARLTNVETNTLVYCCGPEQLMLAVEAATAAWPDGRQRSLRMVRAAKPSRRRSIRQLQGRVPNVPRYAHRPA
jgi:ferredoxin-NADP reductase